MKIVLVVGYKTTTERDQCTKPDGSIWKAVESLSEFLDLPDSPRANPYLAYFNKETGERIPGWKEVVTFYGGDPNEAISRVRSHHK